jgi:hypothetical protein
LRFKNDDECPIVLGRAGAGAASLLVAMVGCKRAINPEKINKRKKNFRRQLDLCRKRKEKIGQRLADVRSRKRARSEKEAGVQRSPLERHVLCLLNSGSDCELLNPFW